MLSRSALRAAAPVRRLPNLQLQRQSRSFASPANKATSSPQGTDGGNKPSAGDESKWDSNPLNNGYYASAAILGIGGSAYYLMFGLS